MNKNGNGKGRGFAGMDENRQREIARMGGKAAHEKGTAHEFTSEEARTAGAKGGRVAHQRGTAHEFTSEEARAAGRKGGEAVSQNREHMAEIGRKGAEARSQGNGNRRNRAASQQMKADEQPQQG